MWHSLCFLEAQVWWTIYFTCHCRKIEKFVFHGQWAMATQVTKHKHLHIASHEVLKEFKVVCGASYLTTCNINICTSHFPSLWKYVWENHLKKDLFGSCFSNLSLRLLGTSLHDYVKSEHHSKEVGNQSEIGCDLVLHVFPSK